MKRRIVLGPVEGWRHTLLEMTIAATVCGVMLAVMIPALGEDARQIGIPLGLGATAFASRALLRMTSVASLIIEKTETELVVRKHGMFGPVLRIPLSAVVHVESWGVDVAEVVKADTRRAPRLHIVSPSGSGRLPGPWLTPDPRGDYQRIASFFGPRFRGDPEAIRWPG